MNSILSISPVKGLPAWLPNLKEVSRASGLGGTDVAAIVGLSPWKTPFDVWLSKTGKLEQEFATKPWQKWGNRLEPFLASAYADESQQKIVKCGITLGSEELPWLIGSPDYLLSEKPGGIDLKNIRVKSSEWGEPGTDMVPMYYLIQMQWYLTLTGAKEWDIPVLFGGSQFETFKITHNERLEERLLEVANEWWEKHVFGGEAPQIEDSPTVQEWIKGAFPKHIKPLRKATEDEAQLALKLKEAKELAEAAEHVQKTLEAQIKLAIGTDEGIEFDAGKVTWRSNKDGAKTDWEAAAKHFHALAKLDSVAFSKITAEHTLKTQGARVLRVSIKEESK